MTEDTVMITTSAHYDLLQMQLKGLVKENSEMVQEVKRLRESIEMLQAVNHQLLEAIEMLKKTRGDAPDFDAEDTRS